uniref:hypothetical protein n=1 Tax=uncultured Sphingomonas sp. TaxID=158754 RepID=UPI0035C9977F
MTGAARGRPLRFLVFVGIGWVSTRVVLLWPRLDSTASVLRAIAPIAIAAAAEPPPHSLPTQRSVAPVPRPDRIGVAPAAPAPRAAPDPTRIELPLLGPVKYRAPHPVETSAPIVPGLPSPVTAGQRAPSRWSGSAWLVARGGAGLAQGALGGQLGGSQAGVRLAYLLDRKRRVALAGRVTSPLGAGLREAAVGVEWQPTRLPIRVIAERRFALGGRGGPAAGMVGGIGPVAVPLGFRREAYGQAGMIHRTATEAYADGALRVTRPIAQVGHTRIDLGTGVWGGAQRGAARLDIGPSLGITVPLAKQPVRLALDWRERIAGDAHPGSGPALTLGTDF